VFWLAVADMSETLERVTKNGGRILEPPVPDGPVRILATIADPEGNPIGLAATHPAHNEQLALFRTQGACIRCHSFPSARDCGSLHPLLGVLWHSRIGPGPAELA
jgi:hypothetical protein